MPQKYISPWPKAEEFRRRAMQNHSRSTWKQPEPPPPPKPKQWVVLGMEVDYNTYREYTFEKLWTIDGDVLKGFTYALWTLEHYATDEHAKEYPIEAAAARELLERIREEVTTKINGKDDKAMNELRSARDFIDALNKIYDESRNAYEAIQAKVAKAKAKMERAYEELRDPGCKDRNMAEARHNVAKGEYQIAEDARRGEYQQMISDYDAKVKQLRAQFVAHLDQHYAAAPDKLDTATMQLLGSGICTPSELAQLAERHKDNPTMLRVIASHAEKITDERNQSREDYMTCRGIAFKAAAAKDGSRELAIFDSAVSAAERGVQRDATVANRMHEHIVGWFDDFRNQMDDVPNAPAELSSSVES